MEHRFKIVALGDSDVGKSSLLYRFTKNAYKCLDMTVGCDFSVHSLDIEPGVHVKLLLWDTAGLERFKSFSSCYCRNAKGILLVFDLTNRASFESIKGWHTEVCRVEQSAKVFTLVGHKCDDKGHREVSREEAERLAEHLDMPYVEASAKTGHNVKEAINSLAQRIYQELPRGDAARGFRIAETQAISTSRKKKCCT